MAFSRSARLASQEVLRLAFVLRKMVEALFHVYGVWVCEKISLMLDRSRKRGAMADSTPSIPSDDDDAASITSHKGTHAPARLPLPHAPADRPPLGFRGRRCSYSCCPGRHGGGRGSCHCAGGGADGMSIGLDTSTPIRCGCVTDGQLTDGWTHAAGSCH